MFKMESVVSIILAKHHHVSSRIVSMWAAQPLWTQDLKLLAWLWTLGWELGSDAKVYKEDHWAGIGGNSKRTTWFRGKHSHLGDSSMEVFSGVHRNLNMFKVIEVIIGKLLGLKCYAHGNIWTWCMQWMTELLAVMKKRWTCNTCS